MALIINSKSKGRDNCPLKNERQSNIELLRIFAAIMVFFLHYINYGTNFSALTTHEKAFCYFLFYPGGRMAVNIFVIVGAWFLVDQKFNAKRLIRIWTAILCYTIPIAFLVKFTRGLSTQYIIKAFLPLSFGLVWFFQPYLVLLLISPLLNKLLKESSKRVCSFLVCILIYIFCILITIDPKTLSFYSNLGWFIAMYIITGYIKIYYKDILRIKRNKVLIWCIIIAIASYLILYFNKALFILYPNKFHSLIKLLTKFNINSDTFYENLSSIPSAAGSFAIFFCFLSIKIKVNKIINWIAMSTFDIYTLLSISLSKTDGTWWADYFNLKSISGPRYVYTLYLIALAVLMLTVIIGHIRINFIEKPLMKNKFVKQISNKIDVYFNS